MNIFEALEKGNGKAMLFSQKGFEPSYVYYESGRFFWSDEKGVYVNLQSLRGNDWIPYVPRGTCSNCGNTYPRKKIKLTPDWACNECGRLFTFETIPPQKVKHKEVFEEVNWIIDSEQVVREKVATIYPHITKSPLAFQKFAWKKTKMTLEWEE